MSNPIWVAILSALKNVWNLLGTEINNIEQAIANDVPKIEGLLSALLTAEENQIAMDFEPDMKQIAVNLQNTLPGLTITTFIPLFIAAVAPVLVKEGKVLSGVAWNIVSTYHASNLGITTTAGNAGVVS